MIKLPSVPMIVRHEPLFSLVYGGGESGTDYATNRQYGFTIGKFLTPDPYRESSQSGDPQSWNRYAYAQSDSINRTDPTGLIATCGIGVRKEGDHLTGQYANRSLGSTPGPVTNANFYAYLLEPIFGFQNAPPGSTLYYSISLLRSVNLTYLHKSKVRAPITDRSTVDNPNIAFSVEAYVIQDGQGNVAVFVYLPSVINRKWPDNPKFRLSFDGNTVSSASFKYIFIGYDEHHQEQCRASIELVFNLGTLHPNGLWEAFPRGL